MKRNVAFWFLSGLLAATGALSPKVTAQSVPVVVDPRIELMGVVQLLNDYRLTTRYDFLYKQDARTYFARYQEHPAVTMFKEMSQANFNFDAVPKAMLALSKPPEMALRAPFPGDALARAGGAEKLDAYVEALRDFARESQYEAFFDAHQGTFDQVLERARPAVDDAMEVLRRYAGVKLEGSTIILGMLLHHGGFSATIEPASGTTEVYALMGPVGGEQGLPAFGSARRMAVLAWHEFSHTFVNPLTTAHRGELEKYAALYQPIAKEMARQAYPNWNIAVSEHVVRAITTRLAYLEEGEETGAKALEGEEKRGFIYVAALVERLKQYEAARQVYPTLADFYPQLIDVFREAAEKAAK